MKVAEMVTERKNSAVLTVPITLRWGGRPGRAGCRSRPGPSRRRPPRRGSRRSRPSGSTIRGLLLLMRVAKAAPEQIEADAGQIGEHERPRASRRRSGQHIGAEDAADHAGNDDPPEQPPVRHSCAATWLIPEAPVVKTSTAWTLAEAAAGGTPRLISRVLEITPNAMPSAPSTSCAAKPTRMKGRMLGEGGGIEVQARSSRRQRGGAPRPHIAPRRDLQMPPRTSRREVSNSLTLRRRKMRGAGAVSGRRLGE